MDTIVIAVTERVTRANGNPTLRCIPAPPNLEPDADNGYAALTLCGWNDVPSRQEEGEPSCPDCLAIVAYCRNDLPEVTA